MAPVNEYGCARLYYLIPESVLGAPYRRVGAGQTQQIDGEFPDVLAKEAATFRDRELRVPRLLDPWVDSVVHGLRNGRQVRGRRMSAWGHDRESCLAVYLFSKSPTRIS
jgi:hypothetical protein